MKISSVSQDELDQLCDFIARLIIQPEHRVASYLGRSAAEIRTFIATELGNTPAEAGFRGRPRRRTDRRSARSRRLQR